MGGGGRGLGLLSVGGGGDKGGEEEGMCLLSCWLLWPGDLKPVSQLPGGGVPRNEDTRYPSLSVSGKTGVHPSLTNQPRLQLLEEFEQLLLPGRGVAVPGIKNTPVSEFTVTIMSSLRGGMVWSSAGGN